MTKDFTVTYCNEEGMSHEIRLKSTSRTCAVLTATELLPASARITRVYHDPNW